MKACRLIITASLYLALVSGGCSEAETVDSDSDSNMYAHTNKLITENSPYLLSHAHNPVDWYPWGEEALEKAKKEDKPIFLSIGYAACHWCHVMERESFENEEIAALMNEYFISIKVDREQRPDLDHIYMAFTTAMTGHGGWPMSVFLTPDLKPFFAGTYFPPEDRYGRPGFRKVLTELGRAYKTQKAEILKSSENIFSKLSKRLNTSSATVTLSPEMITTGARNLLSNFDRVNGGFGSKPKFPHAMELSLFLRHSQQTDNSEYLAAAEKALTSMARGGIYDQLGGGFARYATDARWLIPHFEKMLYDNSLLVPVYVEAYRLTGNELYKSTTIETLDFILREMTDESGGFYSSLDADSEGEEGKFYVWSKNEIDSILGDESEFFCRYYNVTTRGNFEGHNILNLTTGSEVVKKEMGKLFDSRLGRAKQKLMAERDTRIRPATDDKILSAWNGLALTALCYGYQISGEQRFLDAAIKNAKFVHDELFDDGRLIHSYRKGRKSSGLFLEDYAYYAQGLLDLYETSLEDNNRWLEFAKELATEAIDNFMDDDGTMYLREAGQSDLIIRPNDENDSAIPAPGSVLLGVLFKLHRISGNNLYLEKGVLGLNALSSKLAQSPQGLTTALFALDYYLKDKIEIVIVGDGKVRDEMVAELYSRYLPRKVLAVSEDGSGGSYLFEGRKRRDKNETLAYVCINSTCKLPVSTLAELKVQLDEL